MEHIDFHNKESAFMRFAIIVFWALFWLFNVIDKFIGGPVFLFAGKDRFAQLLQYFSSIGIENPAVATAFLAFVTLVEIVALVFAGMALFYFFRRIEEKARQYFGGSVFTGLLLFTFFAIGDQIFGDRVELLEHTIYWGVLITSWIVYRHIETEKF